MIRSFKHSGLARFFKTGSKAGIQPAHKSKLELILMFLDLAKKPQDMNRPDFRLHPLKGNERDCWSVWVNGNWRVTFYFDGEDAVLVDYRDYH